MKPTNPEASTVTLQTGDYRRAVSAAANGAQVMTAALECTKQDERGRLKSAADECIACLTALAFGAIPRGRGK
jgi:hypothetical protein